jgi:hypothetical protein
VSTDVPSPKTFTLAEAQQLLGAVRETTERAVEEAERLSHDLEQLQGTDPTRAAHLSALEDVVADWTRCVQEMGVVVKGLWLVDFDNGDGYYCWKYPESGILHYHGHDEGFSGRMKIV